MANTGIDDFHQNVIWANFGDGNLTNVQFSAKFVENRGFLGLRDWFGHHGSLVESIELSVGVVGR